MNIDAKAARAEYYREWRKTHPDKVKEYMARYWEKKATAAEQRKKEGATG